jgi:hypothetical protein
MANQMIALGARAPSVDPLGGAIRNNASMINMAAQQQALQRQNAIAEQNMRLQQAQEARAVAEEGRKIPKAELELAAARLAFHRDQAVQVRSPEGYVNWLAGVKKDSPQIARAFKTNLPPEQFTPEALTFMVGSAEQAFNARYPKAVASTQISPEGGLMTSVASGIPGASYSVPQPDISQPLNGAAPTAPPAAPSNVPARATRGGATTPQDLLRQGVDPNSIPSGNPLQPMSAVSNGADLQGIVQNMMQTGVVSQSDFAVLQQTAGPEKAGELAQVLRANNIKIMPSESMGGMRSAVYRPDQDGMPFQRSTLDGEAPTMQQVQYDPSAYRQAQAKSPMQSPIPGSAAVPLPRVRGEAAAEEGGKQGVRVTTEPAIAGATKSAEYQVELRKKLPAARAAVSLAVRQLDRDLEDIDYVLRTPERAMVVGNIEGYLPSVVNMFRSGGQNAQNVQARLKKIQAKNVITQLQKMKDSSPQGSSLFGQVTEYEDRLVGALSGLDQTQDEPTFDRALMELRDISAEIRQNIPRVFNDTFGSVGDKVAITPVPKGGAAGPTTQDIGYLRRNVRDRRVAEGFIKAYGIKAFNEAIGRR